VHPSTPAVESQDDILQAMGVKGSTLLTPSTLCCEQEIKQSYQSVPMSSTGRASKTQPTY